MTITIPMWVIWTLGGVAALAILAAAAFGVFAWYQFKKMGDFNIHM